MDGDLWMRVLYAGILLLALGGWAVAEMRKGFGRTAKMAVAWGMIFLGAVALYGLWGDIRKSVRPQQQVEAGSVILPRAEAKRLGIDGQGLAYSGQAMTANGPVQTAQVTLRDVRFGPFSDDQIRAAVTTGSMDVSLLGMSYLGQFEISIKGDEMQLRR